MREGGRRWRCRKERRATSVERRCREEGRRELPLRWRYRCRGKEGGATSAVEMQG